MVTVAGDLATAAVLGHEIRPLVVDEAWNNKGGTLLALGRLEDAIICFDNALAIQPRDATCWFNKAYAEDELGRFAAAAQRYRRFLELALPQHAAQIAHAHERIGKLGK